MQHLFFFCTLLNSSGVVFFIKIFVLVYRPESDNFLLLLSLHIIKCTEYGLIVLINTTPCMRHHLDGRKCSPKT